MSTLDLHADPIDITTALVNVESVSGNEAELAGAVHTALREQASHLEIVRFGNSVLARSHLGREQRVILAGHLDTVPANNNLPARRENSEVDGRVEDTLHGLGTVDMKGGDAVLLHLAATILAPKYDVTFIFYDCEEVDADRNGLGHIERELPQWLQADLAIVAEPSNAVIEGGCQGTLRGELRTSGHRAHTARAWMGVNAIHALAEPMQRLAEYQPRIVDIDGLTYREGLQAVSISGGVAGNVVPDEAVLTINHRFAPDRSETEAEQHLQEIFSGYELSIVDSSPGALPGLSAPITAELVAIEGGEVVGKLGWTDVSRFAALGMPAVNFGPGNPALAHTQQEHVPVRHITHVADVLRRFLAS